LNYDLFVVVVETFELLEKVIAKKSLVSFGEYLESIEL
jgi:hypothetical protein